MTEKYQLFFGHTIAYLQKLVHPGQLHPISPLMVQCV